MRRFIGMVLLAAAVSACGGDGSDAASRSPASSGGPIPTRTAAASVAATGLVTPAVGRPSTVQDRIRVGGQPCGVVGAAGSVWVTDANAHRLLRLDPQSGKVTATFDLDPKPCELVESHGALWIVTQLGVLDRFDLRSRRVRPIKVGFTSYEPLVAFGSVWVSNRADRTLSRVNPATGVVVATVPVPGLQPGGLAATADSLWVGNDTAGSRDLARLDPRTSRLTIVRAGRRPGFVAVAAGSVWVANQDDGTVTRLDPETGAARGTLPSGRRPVNLAPLDGPRPEVWVPDDDGDTLTRIDATSGAVLERLAAGRGPAVVAAVAGDVWVTNFEEGTVWRIRPGSR
jgi:virginiamycin B lyase